MKYLIHCLFGIILLSLISCSKLNNTTIILPQALNQGVWVERATLPMSGEIDNTGRRGAVSFTVGNQAYVGLGETIAEDDYKDLNDFWKYNPANDSWTQIANFPAKSRINAVGFKINQIGYVGTGFNDSGDSLLNDFYAYLPTSNIWIQKASFIGTKRTLAIGFSINGKGYIGTGAGSYQNGKGDGTLNDFYEYEPSNDSWEKVANDFPGASRYGAVTFVYNNVAYVLGGISIPNNSTPVSIDNTYPKDFYCFDGNSWKALRPINNEIARTSGVAFVIGNSAYVTGGDSTISNPNSTWAYNITNDQWKEESAYQGAGVFGSVAFVLNGKGYVGTGALSSNWNAALSSKFYEFYPDSLVSKE